MARVIRIAFFVELLIVLVALGHVPGSSMAGESPSGADAGREGADLATLHEDPKGALALRQAIALALARSPELATLSPQLRAEEGRMLQAGLRPNPEAELLVEDVTGTGRFRDGAETQATLVLGQVIELGGKRAARVAAAAGSRDVVSRDYEAKRLEVLAEVTRRFIQVLERQHLLLLAVSDVLLAERTLGAVVRRARAGATSAIEEHKVRIALARRRVSIDDARHELAVARKDLAATWGSADPSFQRVEADLFARKPVPAYEILVQDLQRSPQLVRLVSERRLRGAELALERTKATSNVKLLGGVRHLEGPGERSVVFGVSAPLPFLDRNQGGIAEAQALVDKAEANSQAARVRLDAAVFGLYQEFFHASEKLDAIDKNVLPDSESTLTLAREGFENGRYSFLDLSDAERTHADVSRERIETAAAYHRFRLELEHLLGGPIEAPGGQAVHSGVTP